MKLGFFTLSLALVFSVAANAQQTNREMLKDGFLAACWSENSRETVDGTFVLAFSWKDLSEKDRTDALFQARKKMTSENLVLLGQPYFPDGDPRPELTKFIVQADFHNPKNKSRQQAKTNVAKELMNLSRLPSLDGNISCLRRSPVKPSVSGSN